MNTRTKSILKYSFAFGMLAFILYKTGFEDIMRYIGQISPLYGLAALATATCAQLASAYRMRFIFHMSGINLTSKFAVILYYVGAFYNFLLPGGIGGDAYKVILIRQRMAIPALRGIRIMLADRASGLCILMLALFIGMYWIGLGDAIPYGGTLLMLAFLITPCAYLFFSKWLLKQTSLAMVESLPYSMAAQFFWIVTLALLWHSIGHGQHLMEYITLYCAASIAAMIPVSVGGLGLKEAVYFSGATLMHHTLGRDVNPDLGIALSLCMFFVSFITALPGLLWLNKTAVADMEVEKAMEEGMAGTEEEPMPAAAPREDRSARNEYWT